MNLLPGTMLNTGGNDLSGYETRIKPLITATGGLMLSQVEGITGIGGTTIQNWIKRGWVPPTEGKRYKQRQVYRIILINILRGGIALEAIADILCYINGDLNDEKDDIISDCDLLELMLGIIRKVETGGQYDSGFILDCIDLTLEENEGLFTDREALRKGLTVMTNAYLAGVIKQRTAQLYNKLGEKR